MKNNDNIGGIELKHVITFQTQIMMGTQFGRIMWAKENADSEDEASKIKNELLIACLRMGWNDAFRHTSENVANAEDNINKEKTKNNNGIKKYGRQTFDDYFCTVINDETLLAIFCEYACDEKKADYLESKCEVLNTIVGKVKLTTGNKALCFGHYQKMFNIALKLYLCLYLCRDFLDLKPELFYEDVVNALKYAECPVDSIILKRMDSKNTDDFEEYKTYKTENGVKIQNKKFADIVWSKIGHAEKSTIESYINVQSAIRKLNNDDEKSNLYFDFAEWKNND